MIGGVTRHMLPHISGDSHLHVKIIMEIVIKTFSVGKFPTRFLQNYSGACLSASTPAYSWRKLKKMPVRFAKFQILLPTEFWKSQDLAAKI